MCGFVGYFGKDSIDLEEAREIIATRGLDMNGTKSGDCWRVAFNRLSIHDLSKNGMQPFEPFEYNKTIVYLNGEIFNYIELLEEHKDEFKPKSDSDVEIIPFLYNKYGMEFLNRLNGMFAIVLIDNKREKKYLIRDRFAEKPLYYTLDKDSLLFSSEVKALKKLKKLEIDKTNIKINFTCWFLPQPLSLYKEVFNVNAGSYIEYKDGKLIEKRWYQPNIKKCNGSEEEREERFIELYKSAINLRLGSDVPVGLFLSGGLDSTSIAKFAKELILDYRLYEFLMSVPDELKSKYGQKGFLRKILKKYLPSYVTEAKKSGPTMPINRWLYSQDINSNIKNFLFKHLSIIEEYLSIDIVNKIKSNGWISNKKNALQLFAIVSFVIWAKFNILNDIKDEHITFEELIKI